VASRQLPIDELLVDASAATARERTRSENIVFLNEKSVKKKRTKKGGKYHNALNHSDSIKSQEHHFNLPKDDQKEKFADLFFV
jgi:hypothetical protein